MMNNGARVSGKLILSLTVLAVMLLILGGLWLRQHQDDKLAARMGIPEGTSRATTGLFVAVHKLNVRAAERRLAKGADVNARDISGGTFLHRLARMSTCDDKKRTQRMEMVRALIRAGVDLDAVDMFRKTALQQFTTVQDRDIAETLIEEGAPADIFVATALGRIDLAEQILDENPELVNARKILSGESRDTPLHYATHGLSLGRAEMARFLLSRGADVSARGGMGETPLHRAARRGYIRQAEVFIESGADLNAQDDRGDTPLHAAVIQGERFVARLLVLRGANVHIRNDAGKTPLDHGPSHWYERVESELAAERSQRLP